MSTNLIDKYRQTIFGLIDSVQPASRYKAIIFSKQLKDVVDRVIEEHEILDRNASSVKILDEKRESEAYLEAVYFLMPTQYDIECVIADFTRIPSRYAGCHLFISGILSNELSLKIKNSNVGRYLKGLQTININFLTIESQVFSLNEKNSYEKFYNTSCGGLIGSELDRMVNQLVGVTTMLNEYPLIRYHFSQSLNHTANKLPLAIANKFQTQLDDYLRDHVNFKGIDEQRGRSMFLILDRSIDPYAPFLHEFTFQAMVYDLLPMEDGGKLKYSMDTKTGKEETVGTISEKDPDWIDLRHLHMQEVIERLTAKMDRLKKDNPHFADQTGKTTISDLQDMVASLPEFMQTRDRFALNLHMASECMDILQKSNLNDLADVEQTVVLGVAADGRKSKTISDEFITLLVDERLTRLDKIRLISLYALHRGGLIEADFKKLMFHCGLNEFDINTIRNLEHFGYQIIKPDLSKQSRTKTKNYFSHVTEDVYSVSRFIPGVKTIVESLINNNLNPSEFPYTKQDLNEPEVPDFQNHGSLRNPRQRANWGTSSTNQANKQRIFVYMVGGFTQSEARSIYELNKKYPKEIIIGGDNIITPRNFLITLSRLSVPREKLKLPCDEPIPPIPKYLYESDRQNKPASSTSTPSPSTSSSHISTKPSPKSHPERPAMKEKKSSRFGKFFK